MNDAGVYILISPTIGKSMQYRVTHLSGADNINWPTETTLNPEVLDPKIVSKYFNQSKTFTDEFDAREEAQRLADNMYIDNPPIFTVYLNTPYQEWGKTDGQEINQQKENL